MSITFERPIKEVPSEDKFKKYEYTGDIVITFVQPTKQEKEIASMILQMLIKFGMPYDEN